MKKLKFVSLLGLFLIKTAIVTIACDLEWRVNPRLMDMQTAKDFMTDFLVMSSSEPWKVYEIPYVNVDDMVAISVKKPDIATEKYQLINYTPSSNFQDVSRNSEQVCWWLFIPQSLAGEFKNLRDNVISHIWQFKNANTINSINPKDPKTYSLLQTIKAILDPHFKNWMIQDSFSRPVQYRDEKHEVSFFSLYNSSMKKIIYLGVSFNSPSWFKVDSEDSSNEKEIENELEEANMPEKYYYDFSLENDDRIASEMWLADDDQLFHD